MDNETKKLLNEIDGIIGIEATMTVKGTELKCWNRWEGSFYLDEAECTRLSQIFGELAAVLKERVV